MTIKLLIGLVLGAGAGYLLHRLVGCPDGACPITANPWASVVYGMVMGALLAGAG